MSSVGLVWAAISFIGLSPNFIPLSWAERTVTTGPVKTGFPADLFVASAPPNAIDVGDARKNAAEGKPIILRGRVAGLAKPFADRYAMFALCDSRLEPPKGCANPADLCTIPRDQLMANLATIQVVDPKGVLLKAPLQGLNGLRPMSEVVIQGTVAKSDNNVLIVSAHNIYVNNKIPNP